jgi:hypothetical protein
VLERVIVVVASVVGAALAAGVLSSRRTRLLSRVRAYNALAGELEPHDSASAASVRQHVTAAVEQLMAMERAALTRRFDPGGVVAALLLIAPVGVASYFAWTHRGWWTWPALVWSAIWTVIVIAATKDQIWTQPEHEGEPSASA